MSCVSPPVEVTLRRGLRALDLDPAGEPLQAYLDYVALLHKWNRVYNLTAVRDPLDMVERHLIDSLTVAPYLQGARVLDVGTGAGLPGIPLALHRPDLQFTLLDSNGKKTRFLQQVIAELRLPNVVAVHQRIEAYRPDPLPDTVVSRAFASVANYLTTSSACIGPNTTVLAMKARTINEELERLPPGYRVVDVIELVSIEGSERKLVRLRRGPLQDTKNQLPTGSNTPTGG